MVKRKKASLANHVFPKKAERGVDLELVPTQ
jgi:hypothetical protein